jgi:hypothetical protein
MTAPSSPSPSTPVDESAELLENGIVTAWGARPEPSDVVRLLRFGVHRLECEVAALRETGLALIAELARVAEERDRLQVENARLSAPSIPPDGSHYAADLITDLKANLSAMAAERDAAMKGGGL